MGRAVRVAGLLLGLLVCSVALAQEDVAGQAVMEADKVANTAPMAEGLAALQAIIDQYPGTGHAGYALLLQGGVYIRNNLPEKALEGAEKALAEYGDTPLAGQGVRRKLFLLLDMLNRPKDALAFVTEAVPKYGHLFAPYDNMWMALYEYDARHRTGDDPGALNALAQGALKYPQVLDTPDFFARYLPALRTAGLKDEALSAAKAAFACCAFKEADIKQASGFVVRAWLAAGEFGKARQFLAAQSDPKAENPLVQVPWPKITAEDKQTMLANAQGDVAVQLCVRLYCGNSDEALALATAGLSGTQDPAQMAPWVERIARCLKAKDLSVARANALVRFAKTGEGENPLKGL